MTSETLITLYDVASVSGIAWSPNTWKARYVLNFKGIPHKTIWIEFPEVEPTMRKIGAAPTRTKPDGSPLYTLPVIVDPSRRTLSGGPTVVSESFHIAEYLDEAYPNPGRLFPEDTKALQVLFYIHFWKGTMRYLLPVFAPKIWSHLNEGSQPYWRETREVVLGGKLEEVCPEGTPQWDGAWKKVEKGFSQLTAMLEKNGNDASMLVMGKQLTFSDLVIAAFLEAIFLIHPEEWHTKVRTWDGGRWEKLRDKCAKWRNVY